MTTATTTETRALVEAAQAGDQAAFGRLYQHYREPVFRFIQFRVGNRHVAEDLTGAYLAGAYLAGANLAGANLADAYLTRANLTGAVYTSTTRWPDGHRPGEHGARELA